MERGVYFDGWYKGNHCYHPSLPYRSMRMVEDIERYRGTMLVWSALGGGSSLFPTSRTRHTGRWIPGSESTVL